MAVGDIGAIIDALQYNIAGSYVTRIIHATGDIFIVGDRVGAGNDTTLYTVSIDSMGNISPAVIDSLVLESAGTPSGMGGMVHISGEVFAAAYINSTNVVVQTFTCDAAGNLGAAVIGSINLGTRPSNIMYVPDIKHAYGNIYAVSLTDGAAVPTANMGWTKTITINDDGTIVAVPIDSYVWVPADHIGRFANILRVSDTHYLQIAADFFGTTSNGLIYQFNITNAGVISELTAAGIFKGAAGVTSYEGGTVHHISGNVYVIFFNGPNSDGFVKTVTCNFVNVPTVISEWEFEPDSGIWPRALDIGPNATGNGRVFLVVYGQIGATAPQVGTIEILDNGAITPAFIAQLTIDASIAYFNDIVRVAPGIYAVSSRSGPLANIGKITTFPVEEGVTLSTVTTDPASAITDATATLNGTLDDDGKGTCDCGFEWGETIAYGDITPTQSRTTGQTFSQVIAGLDPNKTYHLRAFATNFAGTSYGADRTFTTLVATPAVATDPVTALGAQAATLNGTLTDDGGEACDCGFEWGRSIAYGGTTPPQSKNSGETFSQIIAPLEPGTEYHMRAFATNSAGTSYGADVMLITYPAMSQGYALSRREL